MLFKFFFFNQLNSNLKTLPSPHLDVQRTSVPDQEGVWGLGPTSLGGLVAPKSRFLPREATEPEAVPGCPGTHTPLSPFHLGNLLLPLLVWPSWLILLPSTPKHTSHHLFSNLGLTKVRENRWFLKGFALDPAVLTKARKQSPCSLVRRGRHTQTPLSGNALLQEHRSQWEVGHHLGRRALLE